MKSINAKRVYFAISKIAINSVPTSTYFDSKHKHHTSLTASHFSSKSLITLSTSPLSMRSVSARKIPYSFCAFKISP